MSERPLHVQVAEALGWSQLERANGLDASQPYRGYPPVCPLVGKKQGVPRYDTDWAATGPLIEKYGIGLNSFVGHNGKRHWMASWRSASIKCAACNSEKSQDINSPDIFADEVQYAGTALSEVCYLLLELGKAGKL